MHAAAYIQSVSGGVLYVVIGKLFVIHRAACWCRLLVLSHVVRVLRTG